MVNHSPKGIHFHEICVYYLPKGIKPLLLSWNLTLYAQLVMMRTGCIEAVMMKSRLFNHVL